MSTPITPSYNLSSPAASERKRAASESASPLERKRVTLSFEGRKSLQWSPEKRVRIVDADEAPSSAERLEFKAPLESRLREDLREYKREEPLFEVSNFSLSLSPLERRKRGKIAAAPEDIFEVDAFAFRCRPSTPIPALATLMSGPELARAYRLLKHKHVTLYEEREDRRFQDTIHMCLGLYEILVDAMKTPREFVHFLTEKGEEESSSMEVAPSPLQDLK